MKPIFQVRMNQFLLLPLNVLPISHLFLPIDILTISHLLLPLSVLPINHLLLPFNLLSIIHLLLLDALPISHPNLLLFLQLLYPKTLRNGRKAKTKKKVNAPSDKNNTNQKKVVFGKTKAKQRRKKANITEKWKWEDKEKPMMKK